MLAVAVFTWQELQELSDPEYDSIYDIPFFLFFYFAFIAFLIIYTFWLFFLLFRTLGDRKTLPYLGLRIKFFGLFTLAIIIVVIFGIVFGLIGPIHNNAAEFLSYLALLNLYVYVLAFVYLPTQKASLEDKVKMIGMVRLETELETENENEDDEDEDDVEGNIGIPDNEDDDRKNKKKNKKNEEEEDSENNGDESSSSSSSDDEEDAGNNK